MTTQEFIFKAPLFCKVAGEEADAILKDLKSQHQIKIDGFNAQKGTESTYILDGRLDCRRNIEARSMFTNVAILKLFETDEPWYVSLKCGRYDDRIDIMLVTNKEKHYIMKVGQYPTIADMHKAQIKQYKSVLSEEEMKEFTRAIGLAANGVGIGSFVYLRRIFEKLIAEAYERALSNGDVDEDSFSHLRMDEKIGELKDYLPITLVEIKQIYGILSKGIHELSEKECLAYFDAMRTGIEIILDDKLEQRKRAEKRAKAIAQVSTINGELKK